MNESSSAYRRTPWRRPGSLARRRRRPSPPRGLRNPILLKLGLRNIPRRRAVGLIVVGLMLGTAIIAAALATGDTMSSTIRSYVVRALGPTDDVVSAKGTDVGAGIRARRVDADGLVRPDVRARQDAAAARRSSTASRPRSSRRSPSRIDTSGRTSRA